MAIGTLEYWCPGCLARLKKDQMVQMLMSGAAIGGGGVRWTGSLRDSNNIKRVMYCRWCQKPFDFHALITNKLDAGQWSEGGGVLGFLAGGAASVFYFKWEWWTSILFAFAAGFAFHYLLLWFECMRAKRFAFTEAQAEALKRND